MNSKKDEFDLAIEHVREELGSETLKDLDRDDIVKLVFRTSKKTFEDKNPRIVIVGATGVGKSAIFNAIFGEQLVPEACRADVTDKIGKIQFPSGLIIYDTPGVGGPSDINENVTRTFLRMRQVTACKKVKSVPFCDLGSGEKCPYFTGEKYGMVSKKICKKRKCSKYSELKSKNEENADFDLIIFVLNMEPSISRNEMSFFKTLSRKFHNVMLVGNKMDLLNDEQKEQKMDYFHGKHLDVLPISAKNESDIIILVEQIMMRLPISSTRVFNNTLNVTLKKNREELIVANLKIFQAKAASTMVNEKSSKTRGPAIVALILGMSGWMINLYEKQEDLEKGKENVKALANNLFSDIQEKKTEEIIQYEEKVERFFETIWVEVDGGNHSLEGGGAGSLLGALLGGLFAGPLGAILGFAVGGGLGAASGRLDKKPRRKIRRKIPRRRIVEVPVGIETQYQPGGYDVAVLIYSFCVTMKKFLDQIETIDNLESVFQGFNHDLFEVHQQAHKDFAFIKQQLNESNNWNEAYDILSSINEPYGKILETERNRTTREKFNLSDVGDVSLGQYLLGVEGSIRIYNTGDPRTAVAVMGRTLEEVVDDYLKIANKKKKIRLAENKRIGMDLDTKINWLGSKKLITPSEKVKMLVLKWDRNIGSHPKPNYEIEGVTKTSKEILGIGIRMIEILYLKISDININK